MARIRLNLLPVTCSILGGLSLFSGVAIVGANEAGYAALRPFELVCFAAGILFVCVSTLLFVRIRRQLEGDLNELKAAATSLLNGDPIAANDMSPAITSLRQYADRQNELANFIRKIGTGDLEAFANPARSNDPVSKAVSSVAEIVHASLLTPDKKAELDRSIAELSDLISEVSKGDFARISSTESGLTAGLAANVNRMMLDLSLHIRRIKEASARVDHTIAAIENSATRFITDSAAQTTHSEATAGSVAGLVRRSVGISESMAKAAAPIPKLESLARSISETAAENVSATRTIRMQVQESLKRTKRLGERSQELTRIVFDLEELADRVNILALNTSLRSNGGSGTETSLVHGEVEQMAGRTSKLTRQIRQMAQSVSTETREASSSMESMIRDVILSTSLAEKTLNSSNELADDLEEAGRQLVTLSDSINSQSKAAEELCRSVTEVAKTSELVRSGSRSTTDAIRSASQAIVDLQSSLAIFKLQADAVTVEPKELGNNKFVN